MTDNNRPGSGAAPQGQTSSAQRSLQAVRARIEGGFASAINSALSAAGLRLSVKSPPAAVVPPRAPAPPLVTPAKARTEGGAPRSFPPAEFTSTPRPLPPGRFETPGSSSPSSLGESAEAAASSRPVRPPMVFPKAPLLPIKSVRAAAAPKPPVRGPTPVQVMTAVQNAVVGAVSVVSGTLAGAAAARDAAVAVAKTATGAASVAGGMATVASGFFPQLASLGIGVPKAPKNRPGMPPQRRVADIIANPMGKSAPPGSPGAGGAAPHPTKRVQRIPMIRAKSSLEMSRKEKTRKRRSYEDLQMKPQIGLTPHEVLLKVATLALGKTLLGLLEAGARGQQKALQRASERMSQKQVMLLGMLPAQYIVAKLPPQPQIAAEAPAPGAAEPVERSGVARPGGSFKIRY